MRSGPWKRQEQEVTFHRNGTMSSSDGSQGEWWFDVGGLYWVSLLHIRRYRCTRSSCGNILWAWKHSHSQPGSEVRRKLLIWCRQKCFMYMYVVYRVMYCCCADGRVCYCRGLLPVTRQDVNTTLRAAPTVLHHKAELHWNVFGSQPRMFRGTVTRDRLPTSFLPPWLFRPVINSFVGSGVGDDTADTSYRHRQLGTSETERVTPQTDRY